TDLRAADWGANELDPDARRGLEALQDHGTVRLVDVGFESAGSAGIVEVLGGDRPIYARASSVVRPVMQNDAREARGAGTMDMRLDGRSLPPAAAPAVPAGARRELPLEFFVAEPGYHGLAVSLRAGDSFAPDDSRFVAFEAVERLPVLLVEGDPGRVPSEDATFYLRTALQPARAPLGGIRAEVHRASSGAREDLDGYAAVFFCNVRSPAAWLDAIERYVERGGRLVVFLGDHVDGDAWQATLFDEAGILPCRLEGPVRPGEGRHLTELDFAHPLLRPFADWETLFAMAGFAEFYKVRPLGETRVLARFDGPDSSPAMLAARHGDGLAVLFTTSADDDWTDWPRSDVGR
ncbi:MAG: hypothetical protein KAX19_11630, partial [Candidatus Brocadiae bacterium]|nr:hypothetical protein [Candidatus Brocadiia bacterium]